MGAMKRILILSPDGELVAKLGQRLAGFKRAGTATVVRQYPSLTELAQTMELKNPSLVIVGLGEPQRALGQIEEIRASYPAVQVVAANTFNDSDLILAAVRAGADEYLGPPFELEYLERALENPPQRQQKAGSVGRLVTFLPARAGSGASTIATHVAAESARLDIGRTLLVDFDFHGGVVDFCLRLKPAYTLADAARHSDQLDEYWHQLRCQYKSLDVLAAPHDADAGVQQLARASAVFHYGKRQYQWVFADLPPALYRSCDAVLAEADAIYVVATPELVSVHLAQRKVRSLLERGVSKEILHLIVNRVDCRTSLDAAEIGKLVGIPVVFSVPNDYQAVTDAYLKGRLVETSSSLGKNYTKLARLIAGSATPSFGPVAAPAHSTHPAYAR